MLKQANTLFMFSNIASDMIQVDAQQDGETVIAKFTIDTNDILILSLKEVTKGYYSLAYHAIYNTGTSTEEQTSQDHSSPFPASLVQTFCADIVNDFFGA